MGKNNEKEKELTPEEAQLRHQSAPRPTAMQEAMRIQQEQQRKMMESQGTNTNGSLDGFKALTQVIGKEQVQKANHILQKYKEGKANLEKRIVENEQWYKLRHWECMRDSDTSEVKPASGWLFNSIANKHADAMDNFPSPNILPREEGDKAEAEKLEAERKAEQERQKAEAEFAKHMNPPVEEPVVVEEKPTEPLKEWITFSALLTTEDALALKAFFESRNIEFVAV